MNQHTLSKSAHLTGVGLHSGAEVTVTLHPAAENAGIQFKRTDAPENQQNLPLTPQAVTATMLQTVIENEHGIKIGTIEHLLSALYGLGVDNCLITVDGPEMPILDGSALPWVQLIDEAGRTKQNAPRQMLLVSEEIIYTEEMQEGGTRTLIAQPAKEGLHVDITVNFPLIGEQSFSYVLDEETYRTDIAPTRTFCQLRDVEAMQQAGLIKGGSLDCAVVFGEDGQPVNPEGLRFPDEPVRHKLLDAIGDFAVANKRLVGKFTLFKPGHGANNQLLRKLVF